MAGVKQETAAVLFLLNSQMLFEGNLGTFLGDQEQLPR